MPGLRDLLVRSDLLAGTRGGAWTLVEVVPLARGDLRVRLHHDAAGPVVSMAYGVLAAATAGEPGATQSLHVSDLPAPHDARARVAAVLAGTVAQPHGGWVDLAGPILDALVPEIAAGSLAAWCSTTLRFEPIRVEEGGRVATLAFAAPKLTRSWSRFGELLVHAVLDVSEAGAGAADDDPDVDAAMWCVGDGEVTRTEGALRLGVLGPGADRLEVPPDATKLLAAWHDIVRARLARLLAAPDAMIVPWLVEPDARLASVLEVRAACGPVPALASVHAPHPDAVARAAARLERVGDTSWSLGGDWRVEVDLPAGELRLLQDDRLARVIVRHPWDTGRYGALDEDAAGAVLLARWLREVLRTAGEDATVRWHPFDPDFPGQRGPLTTMSVTRWLAMEPPDVEVEPVVDWRVQGLVVGREPWSAWELPGEGGARRLEDPAQALDAQRSLRDAFARAWGGASSSR